MPGSDRAAEGRVTLEPARRYVHPRPGDTLASIAGRELPGEPGPAGTERLLSWNLHLANRIVGSVDGLLGSDIIYVEPPPTP